ncbi:hypothetical protein V5O48_009854 [Marasmius crinis-equi]|uniref:RRM domain-containing protein n=1 Tax=Marasmius crinis-equi TaxID=585013 RepID=A0ABR3FA44_9AGAR
MLAKSSYHKNRTELNTQRTSTPTSYAFVEFRSTRDAEDAYYEIGPRILPPLSGVSTDAGSRHPVRLATESALVAQGAVIVTVTLTTEIAETDTRTIETAETGTETETETGMPTTGIAETEREKGTTTAIVEETVEGAEAQPLRLMEIVIMRGRGV